MKHALIAPHGVDEQSCRAQVLSEAISVGPNFHRLHSCLFVEAPQLCSERCQRLMGNTTLIQSTHKAKSALCKPKCWLLVILAHMDLPLEIRDI